MLPGALCLLCLESDLKTCLCAVKLPRLRPALLMRVFLCFYYPQPGQQFLLSARFVLEGALVLGSSWGPELAYCVTVPLSHLSAP